LHHGEQHSPEVELLAKRCEAAKQKYDRQIMRKSGPHNAPVRQVFRERVCPPQQELRDESEGDPAPNPDPEQIPKGRCWLVDNSAAGEPPDDRWNQDREFTEDQKPEQYCEILHFRSIRPDVCFNRKSAKIRA